VPPTPTPVSHRKPKSESGGPNAAEEGPPDAERGAAPAGHDGSGAEARGPEGDPSPGTDFIRTVVEEDLEAGRYDEVVTRFPPEPNGYLHIGHAKSICLNFGVAEEYGGRCHLRFDDTNPLTEEEEYAQAIQRDVRWLGFDWGEHLYHAADYFDRLYAYAERLVERGKAYVDSQSEEEIREGRGTVTEPGRESPYRDRSPEENLDLLRRMKGGEFGGGEHVLRARIDMAHPNMLMRDPVLYRIRHASHYRSGDAWCIYPLYDFAHCLEDAIEGVTHSLCTLEFENNRALYDWILDEVGIEEPRPHQYEFARLDLEYTVLSKRKLIRLVREGHVDGWDDPRMPTLAGLRRRGVPPEAIRSFCEMIGVAKSDSTVDVGKLEYAVRDHLNWTAPRVLAVLDPLKVVVESWPEGETEWLEAPYYPRDVGKEGAREIPFTRELWIERSDFAEEPPKGFWRMSPGREVRLRYGYVVRCTEVAKDPETGEVREVRCVHDPETRGGSTPDGRKVKGTIHWVSADRARDAEVRLYDRLFLAPDPTDVPEDEEFTANLNPESLVVRGEAKVEPSVADDDPATRYQFERTGYFWRDPVDGRDDRLVFNRIVTLRDTWARRVEELRREAGVGGEEDGGGEGGPTGGGSEARREAAAPDPPPQTPQTPENRIPDERKAARRADPELAARMERYREEWDLSLEEADILTGSRALSDLFEAALLGFREATEGLEEGGASRGTGIAREAAGATPVAAWITNELLRELKERERDPAEGDLPFDGGALGRLVAAVEEGRINRRGGREVLAALVRDGADPETVIVERGLEAMDDPDLLARHVEEALEQHSEEVARYRGGQKGLLGFFIGRVMEATGGRADPKEVRALLEERLGDG